MLRYFTRKLFKSNILPAVIKYKLHRVRGPTRQSKVHQRACAKPTCSEEDRTIIHRARASGKF